VTRYRVCPKCGHPSVAVVNGIVAPHRMPVSPFASYRGAHCKAGGRRG
jgi:hypothetical protein